MTKHLTIISLFISSLAYSQVVIDAPMTFDGSQLTVGGDNQSFEARSETEISTLNVNSNITSQGLIRIRNQLNLNGILTIPRSENNSFIALSSAEIVNNGFFINGTFGWQGRGEKNFPVAANVGGSLQFAPVRLLVEGDASTETFVTPVFGNSSYASLSTPNNVESVSNQWSWEVDGTGVNSITPILPVLDQDLTLIEGRTDLFYVVLEANSGGLDNLGLDRTSTLEGFEGIVAEAPFVPTEGTFTTVFLLGAKTDLTPVIHNIMTPNDDGINDYLVIDAVEIYADDNEVIILDRWGAEVYRKQNFTNFNDSDNVYDGSFDFLTPGNYICILKYGGSTINQVITVLN